MRFKNFKIFVVFILLLCTVLLASMLFYFMFAFEDSKKIIESRVKKLRPIIVLGFNEVRTKNETLSVIFEHEIDSKLPSLLASTLYNKEASTNDSFIKTLQDNLRVNEGLAHNFSSIWSVPRKWIRARQTIPTNAPELGSVLSALKSAKILKSDVIKRGTQLKLLLTLEGGQHALFKPERYSRDYITDGIYAGYDRHNGEIFGFHLSRILNLRYAPIVASRTLNVITEIKAVATETLAGTFVNQTDSEINQTRACFYGVCFYCNEYDLACEDKEGYMEGALILLLPLHFKLQKIKNPWQRTYDKNMKAKWEDDSHYCLAVQKNVGRQRILDIIDVSIFDYLIGNADRHHFEVFKDVPNSALLLIDNGKSFGDPNHDEITILFPLLQCCIARNSTYVQLQKLVNFKLSAIAKLLLSQDPLWPLVTDSHLEALDRRLVKILAAFEVCFSSFNKYKVLKY